MLADLGQASRFLPASVRIILARAAFDSIMRQLTEICLRTVIAIVPLASWVAGEPVQYCRFGHEDKPDATVDFCLGITTYYNASSESHDMYRCMRVTRSSVLGWTAVGTGSVMAGSLMFIIYGDPFSSEHAAPTVSLRTIDGHHQPKLVSQADMEGADLRLLQPDWVSVNSTETDDERLDSKRDSVSVAKVAIMCYSCGKWHGAPISADAAAQPWIWAWNNFQEFDSYCCNSAKFNWVMKYD